MVSKPIASPICLGLLLALPVSFTSCQQHEPEAVQTATVDPVRVRAQAVNGLAQAQAIQYSGAVEARSTTPLSFSVPGTVMRVLVEAGQQVSKGQLLAEVAPGAIRDNYQMALTRQRQAQDMYNRLKPVVEAGSLPAVRLVEAQAGLEQANAAVRAAGSSVADTRLTAPASGVIGSRTLEPGQVAAPGMPVLQLLDLRSVYVRVAVPEGEIARVRQGQSAQVTVSALGVAPIAGRVEEIGVIADPVARTYPVKIALPGTHEGQRLMPGMVASVNLVAVVATAGMVVPNQAVSVDEQGRSFVYLVDASGTKAERRQIRTGPLTQNGITVVAGLGPQDKLIMSGFERLSNGAPITVVQ